MKPLNNKPSLFSPFCSSSSVLILVLVALVCTLGVTSSFSWSWRVGNIPGTDYSSSLAFSTRSKPNSQVVPEAAAEAHHHTISSSSIDSKPNETLYLPPNHQIVRLFLDLLLNFNVFLQLQMYFFFLSSFLV